MSAIDKFASGNCHLDKCQKNYSTSVPCDCGAKEAAAELAKLRSDFADVSSELTRQENENLRLVTILGKTLRRAREVISLFAYKKSVNDIDAKRLWEAEAWLVETQEYFNDPE